MDDEQRIFSGEYSEEMWKFINRHSRDKDTRRSDTYSALYIMGCRCQELEAIVVRQGEELAMLVEELRQRVAPPIVK
jgi:hypothetical protein